ncbi:MaoC family dehydratase N-terminal domain-containing protein [Streptomyces sp. AcE210]|uniref:MaoC family dehydratase N-terminal domain-containing protein n=1 Tax=Streptomyces sp. AcE210 TaxID=2292703 RepID=UPI000E2FFF6D|nr:MaoC family dehydratase N-terminal domain-containing protein [Streptomyces sp. AcE210]RFC76628.1 MaoC family dehydratase [Streptomyces sp. AcE210]
MPIDPGAIGTELPELTVDVERGRLRFFAKAIGESDPVYADVEAAKAAGHRDLPVPPTFFFCLEMERPADHPNLVELLGIDIRHVLHGEQGFTYHAPVHAGDRLTLRTKITDVYSKKGGALEFVVRSTEITRSGELVAELTNSLVVRSPEAAK